MEPKQIRVELFLRDIQLKQIANKLGCSIQAVKLVIERKSVSRRIMKAVAESIGMTKEDVFPDYFEDKAELA